MITPRYSVSCSISREVLFNWYSADGDAAVISNLEYSIFQC